jgi:hypothetical protein
MGAGFAGNPWFTNRVSLVPLDCTVWGYGAKRLRGNQRQVIIVVEFKR